MARGGHYIHLDRSSTLGASEYNSDHQSHIDNLYPEKIDDFSETFDMFREEFDPWIANSPQLPRTLAEELGAIRHQLRLITGEDHWYLPPRTNLDEPGGGTGMGVDDFTELNDTPNSFSGEANNYLVVNAAEDALTFRASALTAAQEALLLPTFPAAGSRDNKIPKFDGDILGWEEDAGAATGLSDLTIVDALPDTIPDVGTALILRDPVGERDEGVYIVKSHGGDYYEGAVVNSIDSVIAVQANLDNNPNGSVSEIEWTLNGLHLYLEFDHSAFAGNPPANLYIEITHLDTSGETIDAADELSAGDRANSQVTLARQADYDRLGHYSYGNRLSGDTMTLWGGVDVGERIRFKVYTDSSFSTPLVSTPGKYYDLITEDKFPRQMALARLAPGGATDGQTLVWDDDNNTWTPADVASSSGGPSGTASFTLTQVGDPLTWTSEASADSDGPSFVRTE